ncbi:MAG: hypothetical protein ACYDHE_21105 [Candidatus Acidiferrales bacterium]
MQQQEYEKGVIVAAAWQLGRSNDVNELVAIMCVIRNWVIPRYGATAEPMLSKAYHPSYSDVAADFLSIYPVRPLPAINEPVLVDPVEGLLLKVDGIYDCSLVDLTSSKAYPAGARYFGRVTQASEWFQQTVLQRQNVHPLIGNFGSQSFYA